MVYERGLHFLKLPRRCKNRNSDSLLNISVIVDFT